MTPTQSRGPWTARESALSQHHDLWFICSEPGEFTEYRVAEAWSEANARLIAAAPDLLAALKAILDVLPPDWGDSVSEGVLTPFHLLAEDIDAAQAAIAKAEGAEVTQ